MAPSPNSAGCNVGALLHPSHYLHPVSKLAQSGTNKVNCICRLLQSAACSASMLLLLAYKNMHHISQSQGIEHDCSTTLHLHLFKHDRARLPNATCGHVLACLSSASPAKMTRSTLLLLLSSRKNNTSMYACSEQYCAVKQHHIHARCSEQQQNVTHLPTKCNTQ